MPVDPIVRPRQEQRPFLSAVLSLLLAFHYVSDVHGQDEATDHFSSEIRPLLQEHCAGCHNSDEMSGGVRLDNWGPVLSPAQLRQLKVAHKLVAGRRMPPQKENHLEEQDRRRLQDWMEAELDQAARRPVPYDGIARRLTRRQLRNSLTDLLGLREDFTKQLSPDAPSRDGFTTQAETLSIAPLQVETLLEVIAEALLEALPDLDEPPVVQSFRVDLGENINPDPSAEQLILGANSDLLPTQHYIITELSPDLPYAFVPFELQRKFDFIEGYIGNGTIREWRHFEGIHHNVFACVRGTPGYPRGRAWEIVADGLLLRPAIPSSELFGVSSTYGPQANFKISLRELPAHGNFRVTVRARSIASEMLLEPDAPVAASASSISLSTSGGKAAVLKLQQRSLVQFDVVLDAESTNGELMLQVAEHRLHAAVNGKLADGPSDTLSDSMNRICGFVVMELEAGEHSVNWRFQHAEGIRNVVATILDSESEMVHSYHDFQSRAPLLGVHVGLRRDCGSTLARVGEPVAVTNDWQDYEFEDAINNYPAPDVEPGNPNYLAGVREIGVRSEYTDGNSRQRLQVRSVTFQGPFFEQWPPQSVEDLLPQHADRQLALRLQSASTADAKDAARRYAKLVLQQFAERAWRRPVPVQETQGLLKVWENAAAGGASFIESLREAMLIVLTSPQFLFLIEESSGPAEEPLTEHELAQKLSYFFWNRPPDERLLDVAGAGMLTAQLEQEAMRLLQDQRAAEFFQQFVSEWLDLHRFDVVEVDQNRFRRLTRDTRMRLRMEPVEFLKHLVRNDLPAANLVDSEFMIVDETTAAFYGVEAPPGTGFHFVAVPDSTGVRGGLLTQAAILAGLSDGRNSHPIRRGAWFARKIIAEPPEDPPPNVPQLQENAGELTMRQKLALHRDQPGCAGCHGGIDPWGFPFEAFDAAGLPAPQQPDSGSVLPDGTAVPGFDAFRQYLIEDRLEQIAFSFVRHLTTYAAGRELSWPEQEWIRERIAEMRDEQFPMKKLVLLAIRSPAFRSK